MENTQKKPNVKLITQLGLLTAIIVILAFTPLGYLKTAGVEITFMTIPVAIGAIVLGPKSGAFLGGVFGLTSFLQCFGISAFGTALFNINPLFTFILCFVPRIACGFLAGLIFKALTKVDKTKIASYAIASFATAFINTFLFVIGLILMFWNTDFIQELNSSGKSIFGFIITFVGINGIIESLVTLLAGGAISKAVKHYKH